MEERISNFERMVGSVIKTSEERGNIKFTSPEEEIELKKQLMELYVKRRDIIGRRKSLVDDSRYAGKQGQSRDTKKYYKQTMKTAKKALKQINKEYETINSEFMRILNMLGISDPRKITQTEIYFQNAYNNDMKETRETKTFVPKTETPRISETNAKESRGNNTIGNKGKGRDD